MNKYTLLILYLIVGGESLLVPAVYFAFIDYYDIRLVFLFGSLATLVSDSAWYLVGRLLPYSKIKKSRWLKKVNWKKTKKLFRKYNSSILLISKFIYGTRIAAQVLSGVYKMNFLLYTLVNLLGIISWIAFIYIMGLIFDFGLEQLKLNLIAFRLALAALFVLGFIGSIKLRKKLHQKLE